MSSELDLVVRGGNIVTPDGITRADLGVHEGRIAMIASGITEASTAVLDVGGQYIFPGILDAHVHFNEPGRSEWEGIATGSAALASGGGVAFFDMPLNSEPPVLDAARLREKRLLAEEKSCVDFALWGGLTPQNLDQLASLRDAGAIGVKAFMSHSGIERFPRVSAAVLREGMKRAAKLGLLVAVHAEDEDLARKFTHIQQSSGGNDARAWLASRPVEVELEAIRIALELAGETGCALHVVHVSSPEGIALIDEARAHRVDVTAETCPHYLLLNEKHVARIGTMAKCAPPIRDETRRRKLWAELRDGRVHTIGSDHSPAPPEMKSSEDFFAAWGGIAGVQHGFQLLFSACAATAATDFPRLAALLARNVARRFRLDQRKGMLAVDRDADFCVVDLAKARTIESEELWTRHRMTPYAGQNCRARITDTYVRGNAIVAAGRLVNLPPRAKFLRPE